MFFPSKLVSCRGRPIIRSDKVDAVAEILFTPELDLIATKHSDLMSHDVAFTRSFPP